MWIGSLRLQDSHEEVMATQFSRYSCLENPRLQSTGCKKLDITEVTQHASIFLLLVYRNTIDFLYISLIFCVQCVPVVVSAPPVSRKQPPSTFCPAPGGWLLLTLLDSSYPSTRGSRRIYRLFTSNLYLGGFGTWGIVSPPLMAYGILYYE